MRLLGSHNSWRNRFKRDDSMASIVIEKGKKRLQGSLAIDGKGLTDCFTLCIHISYLVDFIHQNASLMDIPLVA